MFSPRAEELVFRDVSTDAQDDIQRATDIARQMVTRVGMSETLGLVAFEGLRRTHFFGVSNGDAKEYGERTAEAIDAEIRKVLEAAHERVHETLSARLSTLETLAQRLMEKEVVDRATLVKLIAETASGESPGHSNP